MGFAIRRRSMGKREKMRKDSRDSLKALEADVQYANTLATEVTSDHNGCCYQMRLSFSPAAQFLLLLIQWANCYFAGALGLLSVHIFKTSKDGENTISIYERKATLKEFYGVVFPSLLQLRRGVTDVEDRKQKDLCATKYKNEGVTSKGNLSETDREKEEECGICMEHSDMVLLPKCYHSLCSRCFNEWSQRSKSCPFCRDSLKTVTSEDLWMYVSSNEIKDIASVKKENLKRLSRYIEKLPLIGGTYIQVMSSPLVTAN